MSRPLNVLVACEWSGAVRDAFRRLGHEAWSCDLEGVEPGGYWPNYHLFGDCRTFIMQGIGGKRWDLMIGHPPCTRLTNSGVLRLYRHGKKINGRDEAKWAEMQDAAKFFWDLWHAPIPKIALENPIMHSYAREIIGADYAQIIHPWEYGHRESKHTCLWLKGLRLLQPTNILTPQRYQKNGRPQWDNQTPSGQNKLGPSPDRAAKRAITYQGIADAMALQWGGKVAA